MRPSGFETRTTGNVGDMLPYEDRVLLEDALVSLSVEDRVIEDIKRILQVSETRLGGPLPTITQSWFGGSDTGGHRLATNTGQASTVVETQLGDLLTALLEYRTAIKAYADDVKDTDEVIAISNRRLENAARCTDAEPTTVCAPFAEGP